MSTGRDAVTEYSLVLTDEERSQLLLWLEERLRKTLVEERRTESSDYRKLVLRQEEILESLIGKLRRAEFC